MSKVLADVNNGYIFRLKLARF